MEEDKKYRIARKIFFWLFFFAFIVLTPTVVFYSLGYKFNIGLKRFQKTGAISVKTFPKDADVYLGGRIMCESTPCTLRGLLPGKYTMNFKKKGFYPYKIPVKVKSSFVSEVDVNLVPKMRNVKKLELGLNIHKFFIISHLFSKDIVVFTDKGIYYINGDFSSARKVASLNISEAAVDAVKGLREERDKLVFWNDSDIWFVNTAKERFNNNGKHRLQLIYTTKEDIKSVFFALKGRYLIVHDGMRIVALDLKNRTVSLSVFHLNSINSKVFYDTNSGTLYIKDKIVPGRTFSLFKINLKRAVYGKSSD